MDIFIAYMRQNLALVIVSVLIFYFFLAALQGEMGLFRLLQLRAQIEAAETQRDALLDERMRLQNLTHRLSKDYLDLDLLDEQARKKLGLVRSNEIIIR